MCTENLTARIDYAHGGLTENFSHDNLNRLTDYTVSGQPALTVGYQPNGNIANKTDAGVYTYDPLKPHAVQTVTDPNNLMPLTQNITYTPFNHPETVTQGDYELTFTYGTENQRKKSVLKLLGIPQRTITYAGNYEKIETGGNVYEVHYIVCGAGLVAINVRQNGGSDQLFYVYTDHLGSILTLTDAAGTVVYEQNFDPWGRERNPNDWTYTPNPNTPPAWLIKGFTGHEHHDEVALINMNARMYDPIVARVLSPDNFVQAPDYTQVYNRYSYALNNPLVYTDPDGEFLGLAFLAGLIKGFTSEGGNLGKRLTNAWERGSQDFENSAKIYGGLVAYDQNYSGKGDFWRDVWQVTSRLTWEAPQTTVGFLFGQGVNTFGNVEEVGYFGGATILNAESVPFTTAVTFGSYITGEGIALDPYQKTPTGEIAYSSKLFMHEYGHYIQSQKSGGLYLWKYGVPSAVNQGWPESDADKRADIYFSLNYGINHPWADPNTQLVNPKWWEYGISLGGTSVFGLSIIAILNLNRGR